MPDVSPVILHLVLKHHWFDEMVAGRKHVEYREMGAFWKKRLWDKRGHITHARFARGYTSTTVLRPVTRVDIGPCEHDGFEGEYYRLHLGPIIENT